MWNSNFSLYKYSFIGTQLYSICSHIVCGSFCPQKAELNIYHRDWPRKLKIFTIWPFTYGKGLLTPLLDFWRPLCRNWKLNLNTGPFESLIVEDNHLDWSSFACILNNVFIGRGICEWMNKIQSTRSHSSQTVFWGTPEHPRAPQSTPVLWDILKFWGSVGILHIS